MRGLDDLRAQLEAAGFRFGKEHSEYNRCDWYAYRRSKIAARRCECNDDKDGMQLVIKPYDADIPGLSFNPRPSVEFDVSGEFRGMWWRFRATCDADKCMERLDAVEAALVAAWNGLEK